VEKAGTSFLAEVEMRELGAQKGRTARSDHLQSGWSQTDMHKATVEKFQQRDAGKNFDRDYMDQMVEDHEAAVELFETAADDEKLGPAPEETSHGTAY
jgi:predicted outer membrane protein